MNNNFSSINRLLAVKSLVMSILILNMSFSPFSLRSSDKNYSNFYSTYLKIFSNNTSENETTQNQNESNTLPSSEEVKEIIHPAKILIANIEIISIFDKQKSYFLYLSSISLIHYEVLLQPPLV